MIDSQKMEKDAEKRPPSTTTTDGEDSNSYTTDGKGKPMKRRSIFTPDTRAEHPPTSYLESIVHLLKGNIGPGMFAMGDAFKNGGLILAPVLTIVIAVLSVHCQHVLVSCAERMRFLYGEDQCADYAETVELCFVNGPEKTQSWASKIRTTVNVFICVTQFGFCCVYFVFISSNIFQVLKAHGLDINVHYVMLILFVPVLLVSLITNLKLLMPVSLIANICMILSLAITIYFALKDGLPDVAERKYYTSPWQLALFFGTAIFAFEGIALVLPLKNVMKNPGKFEKPFGVLNVGMVLVTLMFMFAGGLGYLKWGEEVGGSLTLNIGDSPLAQSVKVLVSIGVMLGYPLQFFIAIQIMLPHIHGRFSCKQKPLLTELLFRTVMVIVTLIIAQAVPALGLFISLIGALCSTALALFFPPIIEWLLVFETTKSTAAKWFIVIKNVFILITAFVGFTLGTYMSLLEIYKHFANTDNNSL